MNSEVSEDDLQQSYDWDRKTGFLSFFKKSWKNRENSKSDKKLRKFISYNLCEFRN